MRRLTTEEVKHRIIDVHGERYDLSKLKYINGRTKVEIVCKKHGGWKTTVDPVFRGSGCPKCSLVTGGEKRRLSKIEFLEKCQVVHNNKYNYSKVNYLGSSKKITISCKEHGDFKQTPSSHLSGRGCPKCGRGDNYKLSVSEFINRSKSQHGNKYDYSNVDYININTEVEIICTSHGKFLQRPDFHMRGSGCPKCSIIEVHKKQIKPKDDFIKDSVSVHGNLYDYSKVNYLNSKTKVIITCIKHGDFLQTPNNHLRGNGCPNCNSSKGELFVKKYLKENNIEFIQQHTFENLKIKRRLKCDFFLPKKNVIIEYNGIQHYISKKQFGGKEGLKRTQKSDNLKRLFCSENGINLLEIKFDDSDIPGTIKSFLSKTKK